MILAYVKEFLTETGGYMSKPNYEGGANNVDEEQELNAEYELKKNYPSIKFYERLIKNEMFWTHDWNDFFLLQEIWDMETHQYNRQVLAVVGLEYLPNSYLPQMTTEKYLVHINYVAVHNDLRGCGTLGTLCQLLLEAAEESGVFLYGHSRPFNIDLPTMTHQDQCKDWQKLNDSTMNLSLKQDKKNAKKLLPIYLKNGFCRFDGHGVRFGNRWWKKMCFGYRSSNIDDRELNHLLDNHLYCN